MSGRPPGIPNGTAIRTCAEVAEIMTKRGTPMSDKSVRNAEERALKKLRKALAKWRDET